jgi:hypothetical protein
VIDARANAGAAAVGDDWIDLSERRCKPQRIEVKTKTS